MGNDQVNEPWLDEALTQYGTLLYFEERYGDDVASDLLEAMFRRPYEEAQRAGTDKPAGLPVAAYTRAEYVAMVYQKGPLYFYALRQRVGTEDFQAILQTYFEEHRDLYHKWIGG